MSCSTRQAFERHARLLFLHVLKDPLTQNNGRSGQPQHGVDIFGAVAAMATMLAYGAKARTLTTAEPSPRPNLGARSRNICAVSRAQSCPAQICAELLDLMSPKVRFPPVELADQAKAEVAAVMSISQFDPGSAPRPFDPSCPPNPVASKQEIRDRLMPGVDSPLLSSLKLC
jgi:hypothetical protein